VTGAASGIGRGMAETFSAAGMKVVLSDIEQSALEKTTRSLLDTGADVHAVVTDVSKPEQVEQLAEQTLRKYDAVHVLCNNAGIGSPGGLTSWTNTLNDWQWILGVNLMGAEFFRASAIECAGRAAVSAPQAVRVRFLSATPRHRRLTVRRRR